jgi:ABC-type nitrate/sulfonate/bicarbonate transport system ATPase subunit
MYNVTHEITQIYVKTIVIETHSVTEAKYNCDKHFLLTEQLTNGSLSLS